MITRKNIHPMDLKIQHMASVSIKNTRGLPQVPSVYFVFVRDKIVYIGQTKNLLARWRAHHIIKEVAYKRGVRIAWIPTEENTLVELERTYINHFCPKFNGGLKELSPAFDKNAEDIQRRLIRYYRRRIMMEKELHVVMALEAKVSPAKMNAYLNRSRPIRGMSAVAIENYLNRMEE